MKVATDTTQKVGTSFAKVATTVAKKVGGSKKNGTVAWECFWKRAKYYKHSGFIR